ncbi:MAG: hypothetical protein K0B02_03990 [DPANN group archaeon]|nr:hypothetical protein [DPANN group archaeon]
MKLYNRCVYKKRQGQVNIDFIGGFLLFMVSVIYISTSAIKIIPLYQEKVESDNNRLELWTLSERFINYVESERFVLDPEKMDDLTTMNYDAIKRLLGVDETNNFVLRVYQYPIITTEKDINGDYIGIGSFSGTDVMFNVTDTEVLINGKSFDLGDAKILSERVYTIDEIDPYQKYVILKTVLIEKDDIYEIKKSTSQLVRYSTYDNFITSIIITYF